MPECLLLLIHCGIVYQHKRQARPPCYLRNICAVVKYYAVNYYTRPVNYYTRPVTQSPSHLCPATGLSAVHPNL